MAKAGGGERIRRFFTVMVGLALVMGFAPSLMMAGPAEAFATLTIATASVDESKIVIAPGDGADRLAFIMPMSYIEWPSKTLTVTNNNLEDVTITDFGFTKLGRYFTLSKQSASDIIPGNGGTATFEITPKPATQTVQNSGYPEFQVSLKGNDGTEFQKAYSFYLSFTSASASDFVLEPSVVDFGDVTYGDDEVPWRTTSVTNSSSDNFYIRLSAGERREVHYRDNLIFSAVEKMAFQSGSNVGFMFRPNTRLTAGPHEKEFECLIVDSDGNVNFTKRITLKYNVVVPDNYHSISVSAQGRGHVEQSDYFAPSGTSVDIKTLPDDGFEFKQWRDTSKNVRLLPKDMSRLSWHFTMPDEDVQLKALFSSYDAPFFSEILVQEAQGGTATANPSITNTVGAEITLEAHPNDGYLFDYWEVIYGEITLADAHSATTTFTYPGDSVTVKPHFKSLEINLDAVFVQDSTGGMGSADPNLFSAFGYNQNTTVTLKATPNAGYYFDYWEVVYGEVDLADAYSATTTFTYPGHSVTVKPHFKRLELIFMSILVLDSEGGTGVAEPDILPAYQSNTMVTLRATPNSSYKFDHWEVIYGGVDLDDAYSATATFAYTGCSVTVKPVFVGGDVVVPSRSSTTIQLADGETGGTAAAYPSLQDLGGRVDLLATPDEGFRFKEWKVVSGDVSLADPSCAETSFTMGASNVVVQPVFETATSTMLVMDMSVVVTVLDDGNVLDVDGLALLKTSSDGSVEMVDVTKDMVSGFDKSKAGLQTLTVTYGDFATTFKVETTVKTHKEHVAGAAVREGEIAATCSAEGAHDEVTYCVECGAELSRITVVDSKTAHIPGKATHENVVEPTAKADGSYDEVVRCEVCKAEISRNHVVTYPRTGDVIKGVALTSNSTASMKVTSATTVATIRSSVKSRKAIQLNKVKIGSKTYRVTAIAKSAFNGAKTEEVTIGKNVKTVGSYSFANASNLKRAVVGGGVTKIGKCSFANDKNLVSLTIGKNVKSIDANIVKGCGKLKSITVKSSKLTKKSFSNLVMNSKVKIINLSGVSKKAKAKYKKWAPEGVEVF